MLDEIAKSAMEIKESVERNSEFQRLGVAIVAEGQEADVD